MNPLHIAILHYHLRGGGVTRIIEHTFEAFKNKPVQICVITGEEPSENSSVPKSDAGVVKGLSYGNQNLQKSSSELLSEVKKKAKDRLGANPDVWHVHNHSLGKNAAFTEMVLRLADEGQKILYHVHDFAEDNRSENYKYLSGKEGFNNNSLIKQLYPQANHVHYAVLNGRDFNFLKKAGFEEGNLHLLSNPVKLDLDHSAKGEPPDYGITGKVYLYPCRVIPRKNIGEFVFWSALAQDDEHFAVTLAPKNEKYQKGYKSWKDFVKELNLPVVFEAGEEWRMSYPELLERADYFVTTSIAEGFGLIYLESWLAERPLAGRLLPDITVDFKDNGVQFPGMYSTLKIPVNWLGKEVLENKLSEAIKKSFKKYGVKLTEDKLNTWLDELLQNGLVDFGIMDQELQQKAIKKIADNPSLKDELERSDLTQNLANESIIQKNKTLVEQQFSLEKYGNRLESIYKEMVESATGDLRYLDPEVMLQKFISSENFSLLRI